MQVRNGESLAVVSKPECRLRALALMLILKYMSLFLVLSLLVRPLFWSHQCQMEKLKEIGIAWDPNISKSECLPALTSLTVDKLLSLRSCLFENATENGLTVPGDELVNRKISRGKPLNQKLAEDILGFGSMLEAKHCGTSVPREEWEKKQIGP